LCNETNDNERKIMDEQSKIAFGVLGAAMVFGFLRINKKSNRLDEYVEKRFDIFGRFMENQCAINDLELQRDIDIEFNNIAERYDD
jgi:hypothetical protein